MTTTQQPSKERSMDPQQWEGFAWDDLAVGMYIRWSAPDRGFGGMGIVTRSGYVRKVTAKTAEVLEDDGTADGTARRINRSTFYEYETQRLTNKPVPYHPDFVHTVVEDHSITALWSPTPLRDAQHVMDNILNRELYGDIEVIATAERVYARDGADPGHSGWFIRSGPNCSSEPYKRKANAMRALADTVAERLRRR